MQRYAFWTFIVFVLFTFLMPACKHDEAIVEEPNPIDTSGNPIDTTPPPGVPCSPDTVYFQNTVLPLLVSHCSKSGCHNEIDHQDGVVLTSYERIVETVEGVKDQDWSENKLMKVLFLNDPDKRMPPAPNQSLNFDQVNLIAKWVSQGSLNNGCSENLNACDSVNVKFSTFVKPLIQAKCSGCHSGSNAGAGINLTAYAGIKTIATNGKLVQVITRNSYWMPKNGQKLDDCSISKIRSWVNAGAQEN